MPRRKQDKPQHLEEDSEMECHTQHDDVTTNAADSKKICEKLASQHGSIGLASNRHQQVIDKEEPDVSASNRTVEAADDSVENDNTSSLDDFGSEAALISNTDWLSVKATLSTLQQQMQMLRLQQFQLMQLLASKNQNTSQPINVPNGALITNDTPELDDNNKDETVTEEAVERAGDVASSSSDKHDSVVKEEVENRAESSLELEGYKSPDSHTAQVDDEHISETTSYTCVVCSAVLPSPELLKLHMSGHNDSSSDEKLASTESQLVGSSTTFPGLHAAGGLNGTLPAQSTLTPSYQSVINEATNDDSLEEYMEIQKPENTHLEQLAKSMDGCITDPNQCLICKRVLSCKSALMMHYRTHTGERPFKCKLCSRAFTTKGNLKTHMGVHRAKPPMRLLHSCPICNKQFTNALVLNQHVKLHTEEVSRKRELFAPENKTNLVSEEKRPRYNLDTSIKADLSESYNVDQTNNADPLNSLGSGVGFPFDFGIFPPIPGHLRYAEAFARQWEHLQHFSMFNPLAAATAANPAAMLVPGLPPLPGAAATASLRLPLLDQLASGSIQEKTITNNKETNFLTQPVKVADVPNMHSPIDDRSAMDQSVVSPKSDKSSGSNEMSNSSSMGMRLEPPPGTTCDICSKTFACRSALEIHYRSHTKQRPFKCDLCDKAFTTRGNMKQHILTHKTEDLHWANQEKTSPTNRPSPSSISFDRTPLTNDDLRKSGNNKHQCPTCLKHFSSASAVQIHYRTHTGDRPFKCTVCGKAFTTKGNLKVHMGTHMWNNTPSRRGRRLSLEGNEASNECNTSDVAVSNASTINNNSLDWNSISQAALMKASFLANPASIIASNPYAFMNSGGQPNCEENVRQWPAWQTACHICSKEFQSPSALELHIKTHMNNENGSPKPVTA